MARFYRSPRTLTEALELKAEYADQARIVAGATDLLLEIHRGVRRAPDGGAPGLIDLTRIPNLADIRQEGGALHLGPLVTHNQCVASPLVVAHAFPSARACWEVGAPQIRNRGTLAGNIITASPANDSVVPLLALDATVTVTSLRRGDRTLPLARFLTGFRRVDLAPDEILTGISVPLRDERQPGVFIKLGLRRAQAISVVSVAILAERAGTGPDAPVVHAAIALGAVAPVVVRAAEAEAYLLGRPLTEEIIAAAARLALHSASPIADIRSDADYRHAMVETLVIRGLRQIAAGSARAGRPADPVMLWGKTEGRWPVQRSRAEEEGAEEGWEGQPALVNGAPVWLPGGMSLLDALRTAGFVGVKEGCAEGECGACTVFLDGMAVMGCMVPASAPPAARSSPWRG